MVTRPKAVFNWSGGKDSALALLETLRSGDYEVVALLTTVNRDSRRSTMHAIPETILREQAACIGLPLHIVDLTPAGDMADYNTAMRHAVEHFRAEGVAHFIFGDIFLHDVRQYREEQLRPYGITVVEPLWGYTPQEVTERFLASGLATVIVTTWAEKLGKEYIGRRIDRALIEGLPEGVDPCGENGEYHTLCYDGPLFRRPVAYRLGTPFLFSHEVGMEDGTRQTFSYWFADIHA